MFLTGQAEVHDVCRRLRKAFPFRRSTTDTGKNRNTHTHTHTQSVLFITRTPLIRLLLWSGEEEETFKDTRRFKKDKQKQAVVRP